MTHLHDIDFQNPPFGTPGKGVFSLKSGFIALLHWTTSPLP